MFSEAYRLRGMAHRATLEAFHRHTATWHHIYHIYIYICIYIYIYTYIHILTDCARNMHRGIHAQHRIERKGAAHETVPVRGRLGHWKKAYRDLTEAGLLFLCSLS